MPRPRIVCAALSIATLVGTVAIAAPHAQAATSEGSVTAFLRAPNLHGLQRLAAARGLTHEQRVKRLARLVPSAAAHTTVARQLAQSGLSVDSATAWSITAHGSSSRLASLFGTRPAAVAHPSLAQRQAANAPLPRVPAALSPYVSLVLPTTGGPAAFHHSADVPLNGTDFRNAYTSPGTPPPGGGATDDSGSTIATLQLSTFTSSDITKYASMQTPPLPSIVGTSKYTPINVDGGSTDSTGDVEVDLDQESILSTAPSASQRPYFAPNTEAGFDDVFANVFDDVVQNAQANGGGDPNITALSSSWGGCEADTGAANIAQTETLLTALDAAGVTIFASSGDDGIYDCRDTTMSGAGNSQSDVDNPASSPHVVGVGGTNLGYTGTASAPNNGSNWVESSWTCTSTTSCESSVPPTGLPVLPAGTGGTGGGQSGSAYDSATADSFAGFAAPAYQKVTITKGAFAKQPKRLVPDIAADGDPDTGFELYTSDPEYVGLETSGDGYLQVGGTSLSSPISAALLTNTLAAHGIHTGIGDIHPALYSAYADKVGAVRDVTVGQNGAMADAGTDPSVMAASGYDTNTGIGGVLWPAMAPYLLSATPPQAQASIVLPQVTQTADPFLVSAQWQGSRGNDKIYLASSSVVITKVGTTKPVFSRSSAAVNGSTTFEGTPGATYQIAVTTTDLAGTKSAPATARVEVPIDDAAFSFNGAWHTVAGPNAIAGAHTETNQPGATASFTATGTVYKLVVISGPKRGKLEVDMGSTKLTTLDLYNPIATPKTFTIYGDSSTPRAQRTFTLKCLGQKSSASAGTLVAPDGVYVTY